MKLLKPSLRTKKRYVLFQIDGCFWENCKEEILNKIKNFIGDFLFGMSEFMVVDNLCKKRFFVIRINRKYIDAIKAAIIFINEANNHKISIRSVIVSGTLKKIKKKLNELLANESKRLEV